MTTMVNIVNATIRYFKKLPLPAKLIILLVIYDLTYYIVFCHIVPYWNKMTTGHYY